MYKKKTTHILIPEALSCVFCNKFCKSTNSYIQHIIRCIKNPNKIIVKCNFMKRSPLNSKKRIPWNKGLTKITDSRVAIRTETFKRRMREGLIIPSGLGRKQTQETKDKLSKIRKEYLNDNPDKVPYKLNHHSKGPSYAEVYWKDILDKYKIAYQPEYQVQRYTLDFAILDKKIDLEIDGDQHHLDKRIVESDKIRNAFLEHLGWKIVRIKWSQYQKLDRIGKEQSVQTILEKLR